MTEVREVRSALSVTIPSTSASPPSKPQVTPPPAQTSAPPTTSSSPCCEGGRPVITDPHTGQSVCSCRLASPLLAGYRVPGLPESMYPAYAAQAGYPAFNPADPSSLYSPLISGYSQNSAYSLKDSMEAWSRAASLPATAGVYPYDMAAYPYGYAGMDLNGARRKNATRESTSTLKAWLQEHIKNPYPTKGEKIMLAIITKMTLTQVSTWFANARRRLKKENKMTWSPKNRCDDDDDDEDMKDSDGEEKERSDERRGSENEEDEHIDLTSTSFDDRLSSPPAQPLKPSQDSSPSGEAVKASKPKIWSLADTATSSSPPSTRRSPPHVESSRSLAWNPAALYSGAYTYSSPFHTHSQRYGPPTLHVPGLKMEDVRNGMIAARIPGLNGVSVSESGLLHPAFSGVSPAFRPVEKALIP